VEVNRNKKSVALNFKHSESLAVLNKIIESSDVIVENYIPGTLKKYGLDYPTLSKRKPGLIYASITGTSASEFVDVGYGQTGPYAQRAGYDVMVEAEMGLMHITGICTVALANRRRIRGTTRQSRCSHYGSVDRTIYMQQHPCCIGVPRKDRTGTTCRCLSLGRPSRISGKHRLISTH